MDELTIDVERNREPKSLKQGKLIRMPAPRGASYQSTSCFENLRLLAAYADCVKRTTVALRDREGLPAGSDDWRRASETVAEAVALQNRAKAALVDHCCDSGLSCEPPQKAMAAGN